MSDPIQRPRRCPRSLSRGVRGLHVDALLGHFLAAGCGFSLSVVRRWWALGCMAWAGSVLAAMPFAYQGRLTDGGSVAQGSYDLRFRIFGSLAGGVPLGTPWFASPVTVTNGLFTVSLDFGDGVFTGGDRWMEIAARTNGGSGAFTVLEPRQPITAVPYALFAVSGSGDAGALVTGTLPDARLSLNIARSTDVAGASNALASRILSNQDAVQGQVAALTARMDQLVATVGTLSNQLAAAASPRGQVVASRQPNDPALVAMGLVRFARTAADGGWRDGSAANAPLPRTDAAMAWTGSRIWVWGGRLNGQSLWSGAQYDPATDAWSPLPTSGAPSPRSGAAFAWTGDQMVLWGGLGRTYLNDGAMLSPATMTWTPTGTAGAPAARSGHASAWTGSRFVVWGGRNATGLLSDGACLDPGTGLWTTLPSAGAPQERRLATMTWAGDRLLLFGGEGVGGELAAGAVLTMTGGQSPGAWGALPTQNAPGPRVGHTAVWTGKHLIVWGGARNQTALGDGALYDPSTDAWRPVTLAGAPDPRFGHVATWTGQEMLVSGGTGASGPLASSAAYDPVTDTWTSIGQSGGPLPRASHAGAWTGDEWMVFGGVTTGGGTLGSLQRLQPDRTWYLYRKP